MKKSYGKILFAGLLTSIMVNPINCFAVEKATEDLIPDQMLPYSEILFIDGNSFEIIKGGYSYEEKQFDNEIPNNLLNANDNYTQVETINPVPGMKVIYASDGFIYDIVYPKGVDSVYLNETNDKLTKGPILPEDIYQVATWGSYPNKLFIDRKTDLINGSGRATTFSDTIGQGNHKLVKGDVATKLAYDNCLLGLSISVTTKTSSGTQKTVNMKKWDAGGMPDAVLDIWKTGVEYWGYTWSTYFSMPYQVNFTHANKDINGNKLY